MKREIVCGDALGVLKTLPDGCVHCCVTSPPYWGLRDYGVDGQLGLEETPEEYVEKIVEVFREVRRVLRDDGTLWLNLGDSYANAGAGSWGSSDKSTLTTGSKHGAWAPGKTVGVVPKRDCSGLKPKDLVGIPWRVAFALQADGWWLRSDIIWCLSGGTWLYVRSQKGDMPMMLRDAARLDPATVQLWDGKRWAQVRSWTRSVRHGNEIELVLRSGERIACTPTHHFPTERGLVEAGDLVVGDKLCRVDLSEPKYPRDCAIDDNAAWLAGLYIAEGSMAGDTIQIAGHAKEDIRWDRVRAIAEHYGGSATRTIDGNKMDIRVYGKVLVAILDELVTGKTAKDKGFAPVVWRYSNSFIQAMVEGYLSGDGHWDSDNQRWRLGFTRNYNLERDLRTACARLCWHLVLNLSSVQYNGKDVPTFRGEIRRFRSGHRNEKDSAEIVEIHKARCRYVYDVEVEGDPHLFALASGILTHNSKPNPMPESVGDRPTKAHEYIFLLSKSAKYYYDGEAIKEDAVCTDRPSAAKGTFSGKTESMADTGQNAFRAVVEKRNKRTVWTVATKPYSEAHFATFPPDLIRPCVLAGCPEGGTVLDPFFGAGTTGLVAKQEARGYIGIELNPEYAEMARERIKRECPMERLI